MTMSEISSYIGYSQMDDIPLLLMKQYNNACHWKKELPAVDTLWRKILNLIIGFWFVIRKQNRRYAFI